MFPTSNPNLLTKRNILQVEESLSGAFFDLLLKVQLSNDNVSSGFVVNPVRCSILPKLNLLYLKLDLSLVSITHLWFVVKSCNTHKMTQ